MQILNHPIPYNFTKFHIFLCFPLFFSLSVSLSDLDTLEGDDYSSQAQVSFDNGQTWQNVDLSNGGLITPPSGASSFIVQYPVNEDNLVEGNERMNVSVSSENDDSEKITEIVTIIDTTVPIKPSVTGIVLADNGIVDEGQMIVGTVSLSESTNSIVKYYMSFTDIEAEVASDYSSKVQLSFDNGLTWSSDVDLSTTNEIMVNSDVDSFQFRITALNDAVIDDEETFSVNIWSELAEPS